MIKYEEILHMRNSFLKQTVLESCECKSLKIVTNFRVVDLIKYYLPALKESGGSVKMTNSDDRFNFIFLGCCLFCHAKFARSF